MDHPRQNVTEYLWTAPQVGKPRRRTNLRRRVTFLRELEKTGSVSYSAARAGIDRRTLYRWRDADLRFRERWDRALQLREDELLDRGYSLARTGVPRYVFRNGIMTATYRRHDERLIMFMLNRTRAQPSDRRIAVRGDDTF
ncbi:MAG: hypothetical protein Q8M19_00205 [Reyranella sp.]|nr:hypothetical protein [Reyranella sp.]